MEAISQPDYLNEDTIRKEQVTIDKEKICKYKKENIYKNIDEKTKFCACCGEKMFEICDEENRKLFKSNFSDNDIGWICLECGNIEEISSARSSFMRILHIFNTAGIASIIGKWMDRIYGTESIIYQRKRWDLFGHTTYGKAWGGSRYTFIIRTLLKARLCDIIHVHSVDQILPIIRLIYPNKPIVLHYHGTDIRGRWNEKHKKWSLADSLIVSTKDLLNDAPQGVTYIPNPIDTDLFYPNISSDDVPPNLGLHFQYRADDIALKFANKFDLKLYMSDRNIPFTKMPDFLKRFRWYVDVKRDHKGRLLCVEKGSGSLTGLEALACGLKVIRSNGQVYEGLPPEHFPENVIKQVYEIYYSLMNKRGKIKHQERI